jgi:tight adherence protein C
MQYFGLAIGLILVGFAVVTLLRALSAPTARGQSTIDQIGAYGFEGDGDTGERRGRSFAEVAGTIGDAIASRSSSISEEGIRQRMIAAGWYTRSPHVFIGVQALISLLLLLAWVVVGAVGDLNTMLWLVGLPVAVILGWRVPSIVLDRAVKERFKQIDRSLPGLIDLLVVAVEAGMGFVAALRLTSRELDGPLAQELRLTLQEQTMGLTTAEALEGMLKRVNTPGTGAFVRAIVQGETLGVSIGTILRNLADQMRKKRKAMAEEQAQKAPIKMLFPLVFLIFPAMFVVILLPAIIAISNTLGS